MRGKAFVIVGHEDWGKSFTINRIREKNKRYCDLLGRIFWVRGMSNDDKAKQYHDFIKKINPTRKPLIIATLCPNFNKHNRLTTKILDIMHEKYKIYFWVMRYKYKANDTVKEEEISELRSYGIVNIYRGRGEDKVRAQEFKKHIVRFIQ